MPADAIVMRQLKLWSCTSTNRIQNVNTCIIFLKSSCCLDLITNNYSQKQHVLLIISSDWGHYKLSEEVEVTHKIDSLVIIKHLNEQIFRHWINSSRLFVCLFVFILFLFIFFLVSTKNIRQVMQNYLSNG